jgi:exosortase D (VPLPA-CTERM-specific)
MLLGVTYFDSLGFLVEQWMVDEDYSHGFLVPVVSLYLIWANRSRLLDMGLRPSWWGVPIVLAGVGLYVIGELATLYVLLHLSLWVVLIGLLVAGLGLRAVGTMVFPLAFLLTAIPLPQFLHQSLSASLQLLSSAFGVGCLQLIGVTAFREGNVIDLGPIQLQVVEACSGLRYLIPLVSLALLSAYLYRDRLWKRIVLILSSIPIAIVLNGLRIGVIGLLVEWYGPGAAEGFLHFFEGWVIFLGSLLLLVLVMWGLSRIGPVVEKRSLLDLMSLPSAEVPDTGPGVGDGLSFMRLHPVPWVCAVGLLGFLAVASPYFASRDDVTPARQTLLDFPMQVERWQGTTYPLEKEYVEVLRFDDYLLADYRSLELVPVNFYVAYYRSQQKGQSAHSPRTCIPGGGWEISSLRTVELTPVSLGAAAFRVNRAVIQKADQKQIVYYWFKQRERLLANEYLVKLFLLWDAVTRGRTDGALVRLTASVQPGHEEGEADGVLQEFARSVSPLLSRYVPD